MKTSLTSTINSKNKSDKKHGKHRAFSNKRGFWVALMSFDLAEKFRNKHMLLVFALFFSFLLIFFGCALIFWNEHTYNKEIESIDNIKNLMITAPEIPNEDNNDKLLIIVANINTNEEIVKDEITSVSVQTSQLNRTVLQFRDNEWIKTDKILQMNTNGNLNGNKKALISTLNQIPLFSFSWQNKLFAGKYELSEYLQTKLIQTLSSKDMFHIKQEVITDQHILGFEKNLVSIEKIWKENDIMQSTKIVLDTTYDSKLRTGVISDVIIEYNYGLGIKISVKWTNKEKNIQKVFGISKTDCTSNMDTFVYFLEMEKTQSVLYEYIPAGEYKSVCFGKIKSIAVDTGASSNAWKCECDQQLYGISIKTSPNSIKYIYPNILASAGHPIVNGWNKIYLELERLPLFDDSSLSAEFIQDFRIAFSSIDNDDCSSFSHSNSSATNADINLTAIHSYQSGMSTMPLSMVFSVMFEIADNNIQYRSVCFSNNGGFSYSGQQSPSLTPAASNVASLSSNSMLITSLTPIVSGPRKVIAYHGNSNALLSVDAKQITFDMYDSEPNEMGQYPCDIKRGSNDNSIIHAPKEDGLYAICINNRRQQLLTEPLKVYKS